MGNAFLLDGHTARFLSRERKWGVWSFYNRFLKAFFHCREIILRNRSSYHTLFKYKWSFQIS